MSATSPTSPGGAPRVGMEFPNDVGCAVKELDAVLGPVFS